MAELEDASDDKGIMFFGVDLSKIECMRGSLLNGYIGAALGGIGGFFYTSKIKPACHAAFASYWVVALGSWIKCRYEKYQKEKTWAKIKQKINEPKIKSEDEYHLPRFLKKETVKNAVSEPVKES